jgi:hypothetical protein
MEQEKYDHHLRQKRLKRKKKSPDSVINKGIKKDPMDVHMSFSQGYSLPGENTNLALVHYRGGTHLN